MMPAGGSGPSQKNEIDWGRVTRVLVVKLRSIGDTVLSTPSLIALKRFLPNAEIDILLEDWVAPLLVGSDAVDNVLAVGNGLADRLNTGRELRRRHYDVVFNQLLVRCATDEITNKVIEHVQNERVCWVGGSTWQGKRVIRISVCSWATTADDISKSAQSFKSALAKTK